MFLTISVFDVFFDYIKDVINEEAGWSDTNSQWQYVISASLFPTFKELFLHVSHAQHDDKHVWLALSTTHFEITI